MQDRVALQQREWSKVTKNEPQLTDRKIDVAIVCYPGSQATSIHGLTDLFTYADHFANVHAATPDSFVRVTHWRSNGGELECSFDSRPGMPSAPSVVVVPASHLAPVAPGSTPECIAWIKRKHSDGAVIAAVCGGVFVLAESGLLAGRRATTHWMFAEELVQRFPELHIDANRLVIDDHDVITAGGVLAWVDMGLSIVERFLGPTVMSSTAHFMMTDPPGREQRFYSSFAPRLTHGDKAILSAQHWLQANVSSSITVSGLADRARLGDRTFLRRFVKATGMKPTEYHQRLRIARSRELLEFTRDTVEQVALATGYEDSGGFRRIFKRVVGLSPTEYRRRFQR